MLLPSEAAQIARAFGVADEQVARDHLLSHLLGALARLRLPLVFFGGTALARTHLTEGRLSEDLDLMAPGRRADSARVIEQELPRMLARDFGTVSWEPSLLSVKDTQPAVLHSDGGLRVRVQLLSAVGMAPWPTELRSLAQRYSDAPPAELVVPTLPAFVGQKTAAWFDRRASRDLFDLWQLALRGAISVEARDLFVRLGPTGQPPRRWYFSRPPNEDQWARELSGQTRLVVAAADALDTVRSAWEKVSPD